MSDFGKNKYRIGIDCRMGGPAHAGIGRYIEELTLHLPQIEFLDQVEWVLFFYSQTQADYYLEQLPAKYHSQIKTVLIPIRHYSLAEQIKLPFIFKQQKLDLLHVPHFNVPVFYQGRLIVTIHDLLWHQYQGLKVTTLNPLIYWVKYLGYRLVAAQAITKAQKILVPAQTIKKTLIGFYPQAQNKIEVTYEGHSNSFQEDPTHTKTAQTKSNQPLEKQLIYVGSLYPHKNIVIALKALKFLPDFKLVIVGARNVFLEETQNLVKKMGLSKQVEFSGYLTDQKLTHLMHHSWALLQPSLSEGFGLTGVEAMAAGIPLIASDIPIFREIYQDGAVFFDPHQAKDLAHKIQNLSAADRKKLITTGQKIAQQYNWAQMAEQTAQIYQQVLP